MKKHLLLAILALAGADASVRAQVTASYGDLILGFRASGGTGQNVNLEVDLGPVTNFRNQTAGSKTAITRLAATDIASLYGPSWATRTDLVWGVVGTAGRTAKGPDGEAIGTLWATAPEASAGTQSSPWKLSNFFGQAVGSQAIEPLFLSAPGSLSGKAATSGSAYASAVNSTLSGSYSTQDTIQPGESFYYFNPSVDNTTDIAAGTYAASDLYELQPGTGNATYLGTFGLKSDGTLTYAASPSAFAQGAGNETFTIQPAANTTIASGSTLTFNAAATGVPTPTYQWYFNGVQVNNGGAIAGANTARLVITGATGSNAGVYTVVAGNTSGFVTSTAANVTISGATTNPGRLVNLSILSNVPASGASMGFIQSPVSSATESLLIRAIGPALAPIPFSIAGTLPDPTLTVVQQSNKATAASNTAWGSSAGNITAVQAADAATGAFPLSDTTSKDSAVVASLTSVAGGYSALVSGKSGDSGISLTEVYDNTPPANYVQGTTPRLINVSSIIQVAAGSPPTVGFAVGGTTAKTVLIRISGPTLATFGGPYTVASCMADPQLSVSPLGSSTVLAANAGWGGDASIAAAAVTAQTFPFTSTTSKDSAALLTLPAGAYTISVSSVSNTGGYILIELYEIP